MTASAACNNFVSYRQYQLFFSTYIFTFGASSKGVFQSFYLLVKPCYTTDATTFLYAVGS